MFTQVVCEHENGLAAVETCRSIKQNTNQFCLDCYKFYDGIFRSKHIVIPEKQKTGCVLREYTDSL